MTATVKRETAPKAKAGAGKKDEAPTKKKGSPLKNKKVLILLVCLLAVGAGAYKMLVPAAPAGPPKGGDIVVLDPTTLNLADGHYLQVGVAVQLVQGKATKDAFETSPAAQLVISEYSNRTVASLSSNGARTKLMADLKKQMDKAYPGEVYELFYTKFVTQ